MKNAEYLFYVEWVRSSGDIVSKTVWANCFVNAVNIAMFDIRSFSGSTLVCVKVIDSHRDIYVHNNYRKGA